MNILEKIKNNFKQKYSNIKNLEKKDQKNIISKNKFCYAFALKSIRNCINKYPEFKGVHLLTNHDKKLLIINFDFFISGKEYFYPVAKVDKEIMDNYTNREKINKILDNYNKILNRKGCDLYCTNRYGNYIILYNN